MSEPELSSAEFQALARFRRALRRFEGFSAAAARAAGLSPAQHQLLLAIRGHEAGAPSISDMAEQLQIKVHSATELVARAEGNGLVRRVADPGDRRRVMLELTSAGAAVLGELSIVHREELRRFRREMNDILSELDE